MCIILVCDRSRPTPEMVEESWAKNPDGGGISWQATDADGTRVVKWEKALNEQEMLVACAESPLPFIAHFRTASAGGKTLDLTHPFPLEPEVSLEWEGTTADGVLFHNGHWAKWDDYMLDCMMRSGLQIPVGSWSDSRAMAFLAYHFGNGFLEFIPGQKMVIMTPEPNGIYTFGYWPARIAGDLSIGGGILASNDNWRSTFHQRGPGGQFQGKEGIWERDDKSHWVQKPVVPPPVKQITGVVPGQVATVPPQQPEGVALTPEPASSTALTLIGNLSEKALRRLRRKNEKDAKKAEQHLKDASERGSLRIAH